MPRGVQGLLRVTLLCGEHKMEAELQRAVADPGRESLLANPTALLCPRPKPGPLLTTGLRASQAVAGWDFSIPQPSSPR